MEILNIFSNMNWLLALCFIAGFALVVFEMFHPGIGAPGVIGGILLLTGVIITAKTVLQAVIMLAVILAVLGIALTAVLNSATKGHLSRTLILNETLKKEYGYVGTEDLEFFLGKEGSTTTVLRPSGTAVFEGVKLDVVSEGEFIPENKKVRIVKVEGRRIVVKELKEQENI
ncbi:MAG: hypothetical protein N2645_21225 [Clostridia bacterium]|nr:hypothetical protein [Clostridia bacterium]